MQNSNFMAAPESETFGFALFLGLPNNLEFISRQSYGEWNVECEMF